MGLMEKIKRLFRRKEADVPPAPAEEKPGKIKKVCKGCGKTFSVDPNWQFIPNYCKECKTRFEQEKEKKQRSGPPRKIKRTCKQCGRVFTFPNTLAHYPHYCLNCRKTHQAAMKEKYGKPVKRTK